MSKRKHPNKSITSYSHGVAAYPLSFDRYVVSPHKICLQFKGVQLKARPIESDEGMKRGPKGTKELAVNTKGTEIVRLAVGIPLDMYPQLLQEIERALKEHEETYGTESR